VAAVSPVQAALLAVLVGAGVWLVVAGLTPTPERPARPKGMNPLRRAWAARGTTAFTIAAGLLGGVLAAAVTGWAIAVPLGPLAALGVPHLLTRRGAVSVARLDAMAEWTRTLAGVLTVGVGLEQAVFATLRSCPEAIRPEVEHLAARLRARWDTEAALHAFADDLDDATGDLIASALILGARSRGGGLGAILHGLADSVAEEVKVRRQVEADRAKPRTTARAVTLITLGMLGVLAVSSDYMAPYATPIGQVLLGLLLAAFTGALLWMRKVAAGTTMPRFLGAAVRP
jgi:Flp pilus assembly protein TadB